MGEKFTIQTALKWIVTQHSPDIFQNELLINNMLADLVNEQESERQRIRLALSSGAGRMFYKMIMRSNGAPGMADLRMFRANLMSYGFTGAFTDFVLNSFLYAVSLPEYREAEQERNSKVEKDSVKREKENSRSAGSSQSSDFSLEKLLELAHYYETIGDNNRLIFLLKSIIDQYPDNPEIYNLLGFAHYNLGEESRALWCYQKASSIGRVSRARDACAHEGNRNSSLKIGDTVIFGRYPQDFQVEGAKGIEWIILEKEADKALLISRFGLDTKPYHMNDRATTWETCSLRGWLNRDFMKIAFTPEEQTSILVTDVNNSSPSQHFAADWRTKGGEDTKDQLFLLSYAEANHFFGVVYNDISNTRSRVTPTGYAILYGAKQSKRKRTDNDEPAGWWWLRSPGYYQYEASSVNHVGGLDYHTRISEHSLCVRPAFWISLDAALSIV